MIFPWLNGIYSITRAPITWALFFINLFMFVLTYNNSESLQQRMESYMQDHTYSQIQGSIFAEYIQNHPKRYPANISHLADQVLQKYDHDRQVMLGGMAMRDSYFLRDVDSIESGYDKVAFAWWKKKFKEIEQIREIHPSYNLGVTQNENGFEQWITYQFTHSGMSHFAGNMFFFLIFSTSLEMVIGGLGILIVYLMSGIFAALAFSLLNEASAIPLIGASGAISGIMSLFCVLLWNRGVRYLFFLFVFKRGFAGWIYLPAWVTLMLWTLSDLAGHWSTPTALGGVAYSAHLGGELCGALMGLVLLLLRRMKGLPLIPQDLPFETKPNFTQYV